MKKCTHCGADIEDNRETCPFCGSRVDGNSSEGINPDGYSEPNRNTYQQNSYQQNQYQQGPYQQGPYQQGPYQQGPYQQAPNDSGSFGWWILGFLIPIVGLVLFLVWKNEKPRTAKQCLTGAVISFAGSVLVSFITIICSIAGIIQG